MLQRRLIALSRCRIRVVNFRAIDLLEGFHGADGADQLEISVITEQITVEIESQRRNTALRHEETHFQTHFSEIEVSQGRFILLIFNAQYRMLITGAHVGIFARYTQADNRWFTEVLFIDRWVHETFENVAM